MPKAVSVAPDLKALSELLQTAYGAADLGLIARAVRKLAQKYLPPTLRVKAQLDDLEHHLLMAFDDLYLAGMHASGPTAGMNQGLSERLRTAGAYYAATVEGAASGPSDLL